MFLDTLHVQPELFMVHIEPGVGLIVVSGPGQSKEGE
jgi:hypothetical protein